MYMYMKRFLSVLTCLVMLLGNLGFDLSANAQEAARLPPAESSSIPTGNPETELLFMPAPAAIDDPSSEPTQEATSSPTPITKIEPPLIPTQEPTAVPTPEPTAVPTPEPTAVPTPEPTAVPTPELTAVPTPEPTAVPTPEPTAVPTLKPTSEPTAVPTPEPTAVPTPEPTAVPTLKPTSKPTLRPTPVPTVIPTPVSTPEPTATPTLEPTTEELYTSGYAYITQSGASVRVRTSTAGGVLTKLAYNDVVYISKRIIIDESAPTTDWLQCHFDTNSGPQTGYVRENQVRILVGSEADAVIGSILASGSSMQYKGHPLMKLDCVLPLVLSGGRSAAEAILVNNITLLPPAISLRVSEEQQVTASVAPVDASNNMLTWISELPDIATVSETGLVTAIAPGTTALIAAAQDGSGVSARCIVTVTQLITTFTLDAGTAALQVGDTQQLRIEILPENASYKALVWSSSDETIAAVSQDGLVTAAAPGITTIQAETQDGSGLTASCTVTVYTDLSSLLNGTIAPEVYTGTARTPEIILKDGPYQLVPGVDFIVSFSDNINAGTATATVTGANLYAGTKTLTFQIEKAHYDMSSASWDYSTPFSYSNSLFTVLATGLPDGVAVFEYQDNTGTDAGTYVASASLTYDSVNYEPPVLPDLDWEISKAPGAIINISDQSKPYDKTAVTAPYYTITGDGTVNMTYWEIRSDADPMELLLSEAPAEVGQYVVKFALAEGTNYLAAQAEAAFVISKAEIDMTLAQWDYSEPFPYNGNESSVQVLNLPEEVSIIAYSGNTGTYPGTYIAAVSLAYDEKNYNPPIFGQLQWEISPPHLSAPTKIIVAAGSATSLIVSWTEAADATGYELWQSTSSAGTYKMVYSGTTPSFTKIELTMSKVYYYKVRIYKIIGAQSYPGPFGAVNAGAPLAASDAPTTASSASTSLNILWSKVTGATGYQLYRSNEKEGTYSRAYSGTATSYTDTGLISGTIYYYKVRVYQKISNVTYYGPYSTATVGVPLAAPATVNTTIENSTSIKVSVSRVTGATGYQIYRATSALGTYTRIYSGTAATYINTKLTTGKVYYYKTRAYKTVGSSSYYGPYSAIKDALTLASPTTVTIAAASGTSVTVSWSTATSATGYQLYRSTSEAGKYTKVYNATGRSYTNAGLTEGATYYYKVRAYKTVGTKSYYSLYSTPKPGVALAAPGTVTTTATSSTSAKVSWSAAAGATGYQLYRSTSAAGTYKSLYSGKSRSYTNTGLAAGTTYYYKVRAYKTVGTVNYYSLYSPVKVCVPIAAPATTTTISVSGTSLKVSWSTVRGATGYQLYRSTSTAGSFSKVYTGTARSYTNIGLKTGVIYYYKVRAYKTVGTTLHYGPYSTAKAGVPLAAPSNLKAEASDGYSLNISWGKVTGAAGYELYRSTSAKGNYTLVYSGTKRTHTNTGLNPGTLYYYKVTAYKKVGSQVNYSPYSAAKLGIPLGAPYSVTASAASRTSVTVSWSTVSGATGYQLYRSTSAAGKYIRVYSGSSSSYTNTGLTTGTTYYYKVWAYKTAAGTLFYGPSSYTATAVPQPAQPNVTIYVSYLTYRNSSVALLRVDNYGYLPLTIKSNMRTYDADYDSFNRDWYLVNSSLTPLSSLRLSPRTWDYVYFKVSGRSTWLDKYTTYYFDIIYDDVEYTVYGSYYYGWHYRAK